jgi:hypothetical protein
MPRNENYNYNVYQSIPSGIENATPSDTATYTGVKGFSVDVDGVVSLEMADGSTGTMVVLAGLQYSCDVVKFNSTGTTDVTDITIFY